MNKRLLRFKSALLITLLAAIAPTSFGQTPPVIRSATVDYTNNLITILGTNFGTGTPTVKFNGVTLTSTYTQAAQKVAANLPGPQPSGTYLLTLTKPNGASDAFNVTLGAAGPPGPAGPQGPPGQNGGLVGGVMVVSSMLPAPPGYTYTGICFPFPTGVWTSKAAMSTGRYGLSTAVVDGNIYAIGGKLNDNDLSTVEEYEPVTDSWSTKSSMPTARNHVAAAVVNNKIYAIGGSQGVNGTTLLNTVEEYDPSTDSWTAKNPMPTPRYALEADVVNNKIYAIGGYGNNPSVNNGAVDTVEEYDPANNTWTVKAAMPTARHHFATGVVDNKIYAVGGQGYLPELDTVEEYDPTTDTWTSKAAMPTPRVGLAAAMMNNKIYALGGQNSAGAIINTSEQYDPACNVWTAGTAIPTSRAYFAVSVVNNNAYAIGGFGNGSFFLSTTEAFTPSIGYVLSKN